MYVQQTLFSDMPEIEQECLVMESGNHETAIKKNF